MNRHLEIVKALTAAGANPNEKNNDGKTPLDMAGSEIKLYCKMRRKLHRSILKSVNGKNNKMKRRELCKNIIKGS
jgi:ankyrin repeat protein